MPGRMRAQVFPYLLSIPRHSLVLFTLGKPGLWGLRGWVDGTQVEAQLP
jgi:hypothetical protein